MGEFIESCPPSDTVAYAQQGVVADSSLQRISDRRIGAQ